MQKTTQTEDLSQRTPIVLVVEDELLVLTAAAKYLSTYGFQVLKAMTGDEALEVLQAVPEVHAVFSDVKMPGEHSGVDLAGIIRRDYPRTKVLLTSAVTPFPEIKGVALLRKPYFLFEVERRLRSMLRLPIPDDSVSGRVRQRGLDG